MLTGKKGKSIISEVSSPFRPPFFGKEELFHYGFPLVRKLLFTGNFITYKSGMLMKVKWSYFIGFVLLDYEISLPWASFVMEKRTHLFPHYRPLFLPNVLSDFEIKEFYLTSESDVTYFIHFQANYVQILLSESDQWVSEKSRLVSEGEDFCLLHCTLCLLWSIKTIASVHYHQCVEVAQNTDISVRVRRL